MPEILRLSTGLRTALRPGLLADYKRFFAPSAAFAARLLRGANGGNREKICVVI
jgi:hypothetical protein